ncbi:MULTISPECIES: hypothetical protein [Nitrospirillum]|uniref:hypothetical protein n=1 Tax=Nitrospirillum amazonense TaxID=28077 RepID=UPI0016465658|nr:hypothetical protein [Nitrospirillum amazonense]MEC4593568.1 hypothetical protein [Nitrospirillum amazonense]
MAARGTVNKELIRDDGSAYPSEKAKIMRYATEVSGAFAISFANSIAYRSGFAGDRA